jgi:hypothetical protein
MIWMTHGDDILFLIKFWTKGLGSVFLLSLDKLVQPSIPR